LSISAMMRKLRRHKQQNNLNYKMIMCLPQVCYCLIIQHVLYLHPLQDLSIRSPTFTVADVSEISSSKHEIGRM